MCNLFYVNLHMIFATKVQSEIIKVSKSDPLKPHPRWKPLNDIRMIKYCFYNATGVMN